MLRSEICPFKRRKKKCMIKNCEGVMNTCLCNYVSIEYNYEIKKAWRDFKEWR